MKSSQISNHYREHPALKEAIDRLSDISPVDAEKWLIQFRNFKMTFEYVRSRKNTVSLVLNK